MTAKELNDAFEQLAAKHPSFCMWREAGLATDGSMTYVLEITQGVSSTKVKAEEISSVLPAPSSGKLGVLLVGGVHGTEPQTPEGLLGAADDLLKLAGQAFAPGANLSLALAIPATGSYSVTLGDIRKVLQSLDILIYPVPNPTATNTKSILNSNDVDVNRNFPILWNGFRDSKSLPYYSNPPPPGWNSGAPGKAAADQAETRNIMRLMNLPSVSVYLDFHTGRPHAIMYPWAFQPNGVDPTTRYCSPAFEGLSAKPNDGTRGYAEYFPPKALANLTTMAQEIAQSIQLSIVDATTKRPGDPRTYAVQPASIFSLGSMTPDPSGGTSIDTMFAQDPCHVRALHIEVGAVTNTPQMLDDIRVSAISACVYVARELPQHAAAFTKVQLADPMVLPCSQPNLLPCQNPPVEVFINKGEKDGSGVHVSESQAIRLAKNDAKAAARKAAEQVAANYGCQGLCQPSIRIVVVAPWETDPANWNPVVTPISDGFGGVKYEAVIAAKWELYITCK